MSYQREFDKTLRSIDRHQRWRVFSDFCELAALVMANVVERDQTREDRYTRILEAYDEQERPRFAELYGITVLALEEGGLATDFLGDAFMRNELSDHWHGQFFTPMPLCQMLASMTIGSPGQLQALVASKGYVTMAEPACGSGAMILALAHEMRTAGVEPQRQLYVEATDLSPVCAHMALIQLGLHHVPAKVFIGDSLTLEMRESFRTPAYHYGFWSSKLSRGPSADRVTIDEKHEPEIAVVPLPDVPLSQLKLF